MKKSVKLVVACLMIAALAGAVAAVTNFVQGNFPVGVGSLCSCLVFFCVGVIYLKRSQNNGEK